MVKIAPSKLSGSLKIQPSKSMAHRAIFCAALAGGTSRLSNVAFSDDVNATLQTVQALGLCTWAAEDGAVILTDQAGSALSDADCNESGTTLRFSIPLAMDGKQHTFMGRGRLLSRPLDIYEEICRRQGIRVSRGEGCITIQGELFPDLFTMRGNISSQFVSGLLLALPRLKGDSRIIFTTPLESRPYVDMTMETMRRFGVESEISAGDIIVYGSQRYTPRDIVIEGDYSHAAFFAVGAAISGNVEMTGLTGNSLQGDKHIFDIINNAGAQVNGTSVSQGDLKAQDIDVSQIPDLVPALCVLACRAQGTTTLYNAGRLRLKESDRLFAMAYELSKLGAVMEEYDDKLVIKGVGRLHGGRVDSHGDHRVAMALAVASCMADGIIEISNPQVVSKSAPGFFEEFTELGGQVL